MVSGGAAVDGAAGGGGATGGHIAEPAGVFVVVGCVVGAVEEALEQLSEPGALLGVQPGEQLVEYGFSSAAYDGDPPLALGGEDEAGGAGVATGCPGDEAVGLEPIHETDGGGLGQADVVAEPFDGAAGPAVDGG